MTLALVLFPSVFVVVGWVLRGAVDQGRRRARARRDAARWWERQSWWA